MVEYIKELESMVDLTRLDSFMLELGLFRFLLGIILPMLEAFFPPIPLAAFVTINVYVFGMGWGYLLSYVGTVTGSFLVFLLIRRLGRRRLIPWVQKHPKGKSLLSWVKRKGFFPILVLLTFPFTPSILVCAIAALAELRVRDYMAALLAGKALMVLSLSFIGVHITSFFQSPIRSMIYIGLTLGVSLLAKFVLNRYEQSVLSRKAETFHPFHPGKSPKNQR